MSYLHVYRKISAPSDSTVCDKYVPDKYVSINICDKYVSDSVFLRIFKNAFLGELF